MTNKNDISVSKEEVGPLWDSAVKSTLELKQLLDRIYKYSNWLTNLSILILGFFLATLLQIKSKVIIPNKILAGSAIFFSCLSIIIGFYFKIRYEVLEWYELIKSNLPTIFKFLKAATEKFKEKGIKFGDLPNIDIKNEKIQKFIKRYPLRLLLFQFLAIILSLLNITLYLIRYIFFD